MPDGLTVAIDTSGDVTGVALAQAGQLLAETTWRTKQAHSRELLPNLEHLLALAGKTKTDIGALVACLGPGSYAGLRVGISTAKALAYALEVPIAGIGRLAADALPLAQAIDGRIVPIHAAGRAELAWAAYTGRRANGQTGTELKELIAPRLDPIEELLAALQPGDTVCGELRSLPAALVDGVTAKGIRLVESAPVRVAALAALGQARLDAGDVDNAETLVPLYLRTPAIGPQR